MLMRGGQKRSAPFKSPFVPFSTLLKVKHHALGQRHGQQLAPVRQANSAYQCHQSRFQKNYRFLVYRLMPTLRPCTCRLRHTHTATAKLRDPAIADTMPIIASLLSGFLFRPASSILSSSAAGVDTDALLSSSAAGVEPDALLFSFMTEADVDVLLSSFVA